MLKSLLSGKLFQWIKRVTVFVFSVVIFYWLLFLLNRVFLIRSIVIEGPVLIHSLNGTSSLYNKNILFFSEGKTEKILVDQNPDLQSIEIKKNYPNKLLLYVRLYDPFAVMPTNTGYLVLSKNGRILIKTTANSFQLPAIHYYQKINHDSVSPGDQIDYKDVQASLHFLAKLQDLGIHPNTIDINGLDMLVFSLQDKTIIFTTEKNKETQDYELDQIIKKFKIEGKSFKSLDLRFDKPIVVF